MNKKIKEFNSLQFLLMLSMVFPVLTYSATAPTNFKGVIMLAVSLIAAVLPVIVLLALIYFFWGLLKYLKDAGENKDEAKHIMINGILGFFVMSAVWGFVGILSGTLGTDTKKPDLGDAEEYLTGTGVWDILQEQDSEVLYGVVDTDLEKVIDTPQSPGYNSSTRGSGSSAGTDVLVENESISSSPSWFSNLMPWNWF